MLRWLLEQTIFCRYGEHLINTDQSSLNFKVWFVFMYRKGHLYAWSVFEKLRRLFSWNEAANYSLALKSLAPMSWRQNATNCRSSGIQGFKSFTAKITRDRVRRFTMLAQIIKSLSSSFNGNLFYSFRFEKRSFENIH